VGSNVQLPVIHGLYGNRVLILNNGLKHGFQNWGTDHAPEIDISSANSITIIKGATGVRFGPEALGGAIIIEPNPMYLKEPFYAEVGSGFQTNGRGIYNHLETGMGFKRWSYFFNGKFTKIGDRNTPDYTLTNSGKEEKSIGFGTRYHFNRVDFKIYYNYVNQNLALLRSSVAESGNAFVKAINSYEPTFIRPFSYAINQPNQLTQHHIAKAQLSWRYSDQGKLTFTAGRQLNKRKEYDVRRKIDLPIIDLDLITSDYQIEWKHPDLLKLNGLIGVQLFTQVNDNNPGTGTTPFIPNYKTVRYSAFLVETLKIKKNIFEAGVRFDHESNYVAGRETNQDVFRDQYTFTNATLSIGYVREISENSSFRTNLGTAWRTPNMSELFSFGQHGFKTSFGLLRHDTNEEGQLKTNRVIPIRESAVRPEKGLKFINEFQFTKKKSTHTITAYSHYIINYIFNRPYAVIGTIRGPMPVFIFDQADVFFAGIDYGWKRDWSKQISGIAGFNYLWSKNLSKNEALINQPPASVSYKLIWELQKLGKLESSKVMIKPSYTFQQFLAPRTVSPEDLIDGSLLITPTSEIFDFKDAPDGYFLLDISWGFKWKNISASVAVNNILDTRYRNYLNEMRYFADEPGRNILLSLSYLFKAKK
jgi:iron complex outermembrane receptor protein